ncbi:MAG: hypothetical protein QG635_50, partial [Bacteroidota bacterium]|nr:hypothetical protein [Bacteroidota bacterium]
DSSGYLAKGLLEISVEILTDSIDFGLFSENNRRDKRINVIEYFTPLDSMTSISPSIVYLAEYTDDINRKIYKSYFIDFKHNGKGIRIVVGSNTGAFDMLKGEYYFIIKSLRFK